MPGWRWGCGGERAQSGRTRNHSALNFLMPRPCVALFKSSLPSPDLNSESIPFLYAHLSPPMTLRHQTLLFLLASGLFLILSLPLHNPWFALDSTFFPFPTRRIHTCIPRPHCTQEGKGGLQRLTNRGLHHPYHAHLPPL